MPEPRIGIPYAYGRIVRGGLVRICPVCEEEIEEWVDGHGEQTTNNYALHYEREHKNTD